MSVLFVACAAASAPASAPESATAPAPSVAAAPARDPELDALHRDARALRPLVTSDLARAFLDATAAMPHVEPRDVWVDASTRRVWTDAEAAKLPAEQRATLQKKTLDASFYWETRYGSPLAYVRAIDLLSDAGLRSLGGKRLLDFGYGTIGHLRLLAQLGTDAVGVDVDPMLRAIYSAPGDTGAVGAGHVTLATGLWPAIPSVRDAVGGRFDVFLSKNTLKRGYVHPEYAVRRPFDLGVDDATFLAAVHDAVVPGGLVLLYNVCPAQVPHDRGYVPWADGRSPFDRAAWEHAGFQVVALDRDDTPAIRAVARALGWDQGEDAMDLEHDLVATYTLAIDGGTPPAR